MRQIVNTETEFEDAVKDASIDYVQLADTITLTKSIRILATKTQMVIDGEDPYTPGLIHAINDYGTVLSTDAFGIHASSSIVLTLRNLRLNGTNYYGMPYIASYVWGIIDTHEVVVTYENITYEGPQMTYNHNGKTIYDSCDITIRQTGGAEAQEVGEVNNVEFRGNTVINHLSTVSNAVFWFRDETQNSSMIIGENASVSVYSENFYFMYNMDGTFLTTPVPTELILEPSAKMILLINNGFSLNSNHKLKRLVVGRDAYFEYKQVGDINRPMMEITDSIECEEGSMLFMYGLECTQPLINFAGNATLTLDKPADFALYCNNHSALSMQGTLNYSMRVGQLNLWDQAGDAAVMGGLDDIPDKKWHKHLYNEILEVNGQLTSLSNQATTNLDEADEPYLPLSDMTIYSAPAISAGGFITSVNPIYNNGTPVTGLCEYDSTVRITYMFDEQEVKTTDVTQEKAFSLPIEVLDVGTPVLFESNIKFLIYEREMLVIEPEEVVIISAPTSIDYKAQPLDLPTIILPRLENQPVIVRDSYQSPHSWGLTVRVAAPMQANGHILSDAIVFRKDGVVTMLSSENDTIIYTGGSSTGDISVLWAENEGILLNINTPLHTGEHYQGEIVWGITTEI